MSRGGSSGDDEVVKDLEAFGASQDVIDTYKRDAEKSVNYNVWPENWDVFLFFLRVSSQWRIAPMGGMLGFDYIAIKTVADFAGIVVTTDMFADLERIEREVLSCYHEHESRK